MPDITDQDRRDMLEWARIAVASKDSQEHEPWVTAARYILATVDAPAPTLAEELRDLFAPYATAEQEHIISRAKQTEQERDYLAAEIDKANTDILHLTAERDRLEAAQYLSDGSAWGGPVREPTVQKGAESNAESIDPADVKPGEAWIVEVNGKRGTAVKDSGGVAPWSVVIDGAYSSRCDEFIILRSRLVPAPRVITNHDELEALPHRTVIRDAELSVGEKSGNYWDITGSCCDALSDYFVLPVTVLWDPEA